MSFARVLLVVVCAVACHSAFAQDPDVQRTGPELISSKGYPVEIHFVETSDHYVLQMFRIPQNGPVALLQHGLLDSADTWLVNPADSSLAYLMYDAGFDVWLGNSRGNKYSRNNTEHNPNWNLFDNSFWDFSFDEMASIDMPTQVNYALTVSGRSKLTFVGHSQGTTQAFANFARTDWSVANKVSLFAALAPVAYVGNTQSILLKALADVDLDALVKFLGVDEFLPTSSLLRWLLPTVCDSIPLLCESVIYIFAGLDLGDLDKSRLDVYTAHFPSGTSVQDVSHWAQEIRDSEFVEYDYGLIGNLEEYGTASPPQYDLSQVSAPAIAIWYGGNDDLADPTDVQSILNQVAAGTVVYQQYIQDYAHLDFVWGVHANTTIYSQLIQLAQQHATD